MNIFNQWKYVNLPLGYAKEPSKIKGGNWCLICCICLLFSITFGIPLYPKFLNWLLRQNNGYRNKAEVKWHVLSDLLKVKFHLSLFDGKNHPKDIKAPAIVSYDIIPGGEYNSHFVILLSLLKNGEMFVFDPLIGGTRIMDEVIFSVISISKKNV